MVVVLRLTVETFRTSKPDIPRRNEVHSQTVGKAKNLLVLLGVFAAKREHLCLVHACDVQRLLPNRNRCWRIVFGKFPHREIEQVNRRLPAREGAVVAGKGEIAPRLFVGARPQFLQKGADGLLVGAFVVFSQRGVAIAVKNELLVVESRRVVDSDGLEFLQRQPGQMGTEVLQAVAAETSASFGFMGIAAPLQHLPRVGIVHVHVGGARLHREHHVLFHQAEEIGVAVAAPRRAPVLPTGGQRLPAAAFGAADLVGGAGASFAGTAVPPRRRSAVTDRITALCALHDELLRRIHPVEPRAVKRRDLLERVHFLAHPADGKGNVAMLRRAYWPLPAQCQLRYRRLLRLRRRSDQVRAGLVGGVQRGQRREQEGGEERERVIHGDASVVGVH